MASPRFDSLRRTRIAALFSELQNQSANMRDALVLTGIAALVRIAVVVWASTRFPPSDDGSFYHVVASRIAQGLGYTWLWPDGAVTYAAHYPVGYPALIGGMYAIFGASPLVAMLFNALIGTLCVFAVHRIAARV